MCQGCHKKSRERTLKSQIVMKKYFKKGFVLFCAVALLLATFFSACGKKAPPKPPIKKSEKLEIEKSK
jgi:hypothetical protein